MTHPRNIPKPLLKLIHYPPRLFYAIGLGPIIGKMVLLLTTTGRKTGKKRVTPLQYEEIDDRVFLGAMAGQRTDWYRNILVNPRVEIHLKSRHFWGTAEPITDPVKIADYLEIRLQRHPRIVGAILRSAGIQDPPSREALVSYGQGITVVMITPE